MSSFRAASRINKSNSFSMPECISNASATYAVGASYALRKVAAGARYAIRVRESGANVEKDIGFSGKGLDTVALLAHCGVNSGYIVTWYDQSGNGNHVTMATADAQPHIVSSGVVDVDALGRPTIVFDGSDDRLVNTANHASINIASQPLLINGVYTPASDIAADSYFICKNDAASSATQYRLIYIVATQATRFSIEGATGNVCEGAANSVVKGATGITSGIWESGAMAVTDEGAKSGTTDTYAGALTSRANLVISGRSNAADASAIVSPFKGTISELHILRLSGDSDRLKLERNQGKYYGIAVA